MVPTHHETMKGQSEIRADDGRVDVVDDAHVHVMGDSRWGVENYQKGDFQTSVIVR